MSNLPPDLVVVGGSAGGVEALKRLVATLPADLPASVLVGLHLSPTTRSLLTGILARHTALEVVSAEAGLSLAPGRVVVAQPDTHLLVVDDHVVLGSGARENGHRPAHDAMMRSAALARGPRAVGVVLTGLLDDGAAGLACLARYGATCLVQDPAEAEFPSMPLHALAAVPVARVLPLSALSAEVVRAVTAPAPDPWDVTPDRRALDQAELASALGGAPVGLAGRGHPVSPSSFSCPDCQGVLHSVAEPGPVTRYRCRTGHAWTAGSLLSSQHDAVEEALWMALRALEERADLAKRLADQALGQRPRSAQLFAGSAREATRSAEVLRGLLSQRAAVDVDPESSTVTS